MSAGLQDTRRAGGSSRPSSGGGVTLRQRGVALITALLVVALASITAFAMVSRQHMDIRRTTQMFALDQIRLLSLGVEAHALDLLLIPDSGERELPWEGCRSPAIPVNLDGVEILVQVEDMHCRFNINTLAGEDTQAREIFLRLLREIASRTPGLALDADSLSQAIVDQLDPDTGDPAHAGLPQAHASETRLMLSVTELRPVPGMSTGIWQALAPHVATLPQTVSSIHLEHAGEPLRMAVEDTAWGQDDQASRYFRLALRADLAGQVFRLCSLLDTHAGQVVLREHSSCPP